MFNSGKTGGYGPTDVTLQGVHITYVILVKKKKNYPESNDNEKKINSEIGISHK